MATIPLALQDEIDYPSSTIPLDHIKFPRQKCKDFPKLLQKISVVDFANNLELTNSELVLSRDQIAACWTKLVSDKWGLFKLEAEPSDVELYWSKVKETLLQPQTQIWFTKAERYADRIMNPGFKHGSLCRMRAAERDIDLMMQDTLSSMFEGVNVSKGGFGAETEASHFNVEHKQLLDRFTSEIQQKEDQINTKHAIIAVLEKEAKDKKRRKLEEGISKTKRKEEINQLRQETSRPACVEGPMPDQLLRFKRSHKRKSKRERLKLKIQERQGEEMELDQTESSNKFKDSAKEIQGSMNKDAGASSWETLT